MLVTLFLSATHSFAQNRKDLAVSAAGGRLNSPYYKKAHPKGFFGLEFDYHLSEKNVLSVAYVNGSHYYVDDVLSNTPLSQYAFYPPGANAEAYYDVFSVGYKRKIINRRRFSLAPGVGIGWMTLKREYPYTRGPSMSIEQSVFSDFAFPVTLDAMYKLTNRWQVGLAGGFLVEPDYPILALRAGIRVSYVLP